MNIGETVKKSTTQFVNDNLTNKDMIYRAYITDINDKSRSMPRYFWCQFMPMIISLVLMFIVITVNTEYFNGNIWLFAAMVILNLYAVAKDYFGLSKMMTYGVIHILTKIDEYSYYEVLLSHYFKQEVSNEVKEEILKRYSKEEVMKLTSNGIITNSDAWGLK